MQTFPASFSSKYKQPLGNLLSTEIMVRLSTSVSLSSLSSPSSINPSIPSSTNNVKPVSNASHSWGITQPSNYKNHERTLRFLDYFVKRDMFYKIKFISNPNQVAFSECPQSICQVVCMHFNVPGDEQQNFWQTYSKVVKKN